MTQTVRSFIYGCLRRFILKPWWSAHKWRVGRFVSFCKSLYDNMKSFDVNFIELYWEMKFTWNSWSWITLWKKILRPKKKWNIHKNNISKIERPGFGGSDGLRHFSKIMWFLQILSITMKKWFFSEYLISENLSKNALEM